MQLPHKAVRRLRGLENCRVVVRRRVRREHFLLALALFDQVRHLIADRQDHVAVGDHRLPNRPPGVV